jgi:hypothetical protein
MVSSELASPVYLLIQPEPGPTPFAVTLWLLSPNAFAEPIMAAPRASWHDVARRIEQAGLLDHSILGCVDAQIGRGESVLRPISCTRDDLRKIGLIEVPGMSSKKLPPSLLRFSRNKSKLLRSLLPAQS